MKPIIHSYKIVGVRVNSLGKPECKREFTDTFLQAKHAKEHMLGQGYRAFIFTRADAHSQTFTQAVGR